MEFDAAYYQQFSDEDMRRRCEVRAERLARFFALTDPPPPVSVVQDAFELFEGAYREWVRRQQPKGE